MKAKRYIIGILLAIFSLVLVFWLGTLEFFQVLELKTLDYRFKGRPQHNVNENITIIAIDDYALNVLGRWPFSRKNHAALMEVLSVSPPRCTGFDILFVEPEENDESLAYYTKLLGNIVYAGYIRESDKVLISPVSDLLLVSKTGFINVPRDKDGVIRKIPLVIKYKGKMYPSFALQVLCNYLDVEFDDLKIDMPTHRCGGISIPGLAKEIPVDANGSMWINFVGDQHVFKEFSFPQVLSWKNDENKLRFFGDKLVLVGLTATGTADQGNIPVAINVPLIAVQANAINTILNEDYLSHIPDVLNLSLILFMLILSLWINVSMKPFKAAGITLIILVGFCAVNFWFFMNNIWIDLLQPCSGLLIPFILITIYRYGWEERERRWIKKAFSHYLSSEVIQQILSSPERLKLGGELREATALFLDLRNFTTFCEGRPPTEVVRLLNECFDWMTEIILRHRGMLDKYMGDAIMAVFGAPSVMPAAEQAKRAVSAALEICKKSKEQSPSLGIGIGINTGPMVVGNMGSRYIFNYTAIGDEVNVAMRVQELTREYKTNIIVTESVYKHIKDMVKAEPLGNVGVKGRKEPVKIYALLEK